MLSPYKYATVGLAVALLLVTATHLDWPVIDKLFVDEAGMYVRDNWEIPESWASHRWESSNRTEAIYFTEYADCTLQISKGGTGMKVVSILSLLECSREDGVTHVMDSPDGLVKFETVPSDFEAAWTDRAFCSMYATHHEQGDGDIDVILHTYCGGLTPRSWPLNWIHGYDATAHTPDIFRIGVSIDRMEWESDLDTGGIYMDGSETPVKTSL